MTTETNEDALALHGLIEVMGLLHVAGDRDTVLRAVVTGVCGALGYELAVIRVLDANQGVLQTAAVEGPPDATAALTGRSLPLTELVAEFEWADRYDDIYFIPWERLPEDVISTWVPDLPVDDSHDAWHPMDALYVALNDREGQMLGVLGVDLPIDGRRPGPRQRQLLQIYARQAALAIERTKMLDQQARLVASLMSRQQEASALVATLTHDLKAPLTVIQGHAELARDDAASTGSGLDRHLDGIDHAVRRMTSTIDELLIQREADHDDVLGLAPGAPVDLAGVVSEIVTVSRVVAERRGLVLEFALYGEHTHVLGDRHQLLRAVDNLATNALKYTPSGGRIVLGVDGRGEEVVVTCSDDGVGIPAAEQDEVFLDYGRAEQARSAGIEGSGLGLPSARRTVLAHGGTLSLESTPGVGSVFTARFPRAEESGQGPSHG